MHFPIHRLTLAIHQAKALQYLSQLPSKQSALFLVVSLFLIGLYDPSVVAVVALGVDINEIWK